MSMADHDHASTDVELAMAELSPPSSSSPPPSSAADPIPDPDPDDPGSDLGHLDLDPEKGLLEDMALCRRGFQTRTSRRAGDGVAFDVGSMFRRLDALGGGGHTEGADAAVTEKGFVEYVTKMNLAAKVNRSANHQGLSAVRVEGSPLSAHRIHAVFRRISNRGGQIGRQDFDSFVHGGTSEHERSPAPERSQLQPRKAAAREALYSPEATESALSPGTGMGRVRGRGGGTGRSRGRGRDRGAQQHNGVANEVATQGDKGGSSGQLQGAPPWQQISLKAPQSRPPHWQN
jgi:hypothetical protein